MGTSWDVAKILYDKIEYMSCKIFELTYMTLCSYIFWNLINNLKVINDLVVWCGSWGDEIYILDKCSKS